MQHPLFIKALYEKKGFSIVEFKGKENAMLPSFTNEGNTYVEKFESFEDVPFE